MKWDAKKLDALVDEMKKRVTDGLEEERKNGVSEEASIACVIGYWMMQLKECREAA